MSVHSTVLIKKCSASFSSWCLPAYGRTLHVAARYKTFDQSLVANTDHTGQISWGFDYTSPCGLRWEFHPTFTQLQHESRLEKTIVSRTDTKAWVSDTERVSRATTRWKCGQLYLFPGPLTSIKQTITRILLRRFLLNRETLLLPAAQVDKD